MKEPERIKISEKEADELLQRVKSGHISCGDYQLLENILKSWSWVSITLEKSKVSIKELKKLLFGAKTEKTGKVFKKSPEARELTKKPKKKNNGHGRNSADAYKGAEKVCICCSELKIGDLCPKCGKGKLYACKPKKIVCISGDAPIRGKRYELERLRCNLCSELFSADVPKDATGPKYDSGSVSMMALLHYGYGLPFNRIADLQENAGIPLSSSTQWDELKKFFDSIHPLYDQLSYHASTGGVFHNDDTTARILEVEKQIASEQKTCLAR